MISLTLENKNERISAVITVLIHLLILLIAIFFVTCHYAPTPPLPPDTQGINIAFGTISEAKGETENPLDAAPKETAVQPEVVPEEIIEPVAEEVVPVVDEPLESDHNVAEVDNSAVNQAKNEIVTTEIVEPQNDVDNSELEPNDNEVDTNTADPGLDPLPSFPVGGSGDQHGNVGNENGDEFALKSGIGVGTMPAGWGVSSEPKLDSIVDDFHLEISLEFDRSGNYIPNSMKYVSGAQKEYGIYEEYLNTVLRKELKYNQTNTSEAPKSRNKATFRFEFKGH